MCTEITVTLDDYFNMMKNLFRRARHQVPYNFTKSIIKFPKFWC